MTAPAFQGTPAFASDSSSVATIPAPKPSGLADGEYLVAIFGVADGTTLTPPSGWDTIIPPVSNALTSTWLAIYGRYVATAAGEPASYGFGASPITGYVVAVGRWNGVDSTSHFEPASPPTLNPSGSLNRPCPTMTTQDFDRCVLTGGCYDSTSTVTPDAGTTERIEGTSGSRGVYLEDEAKATAGVTTARTWTLSVTTTNCSTFAFALIPAGPPPVQEQLEPRTYIVDYGS